MSRIALPTGAAAQPTPRAEARRARPRTISIVIRLLFAIVIAGLLPLIVATVSALNGYSAASKQAISSTNTVLDDSAIAALQQRTTQTAREMGHFLDERVGDARAAALLPLTPAAYVEFANTHTSELWYVTGTRAQPVERREQFPLYREIQAIDRDGRLVARVVDGIKQTDPGDPKTTAAYFAEGEKLPPGSPSVSHLIRTYTTRPPDYMARPLGADYLAFDGIYRMLVSRRAADGSPDGVVMLALDARHVMEFVIHIVPTHSTESAVWPDYESGNYAFAFDDEGWEIIHPRLFIVRGNDANGNLMSPATGDMDNNGRISHPYYVPVGAWADPNLPLVFEKGRSRETGFVFTTNGAGVTRAITYAPIPFATGDYATYRVFGVLAVGANTAEFHRSSAAVAASIEEERQRLQNQIILVVVGSLVLLALTGAIFSRTLVRPLTRLTAVARHLKEGSFDERRLEEIRNRRFADEVTILADVFAEMGRQVVKREQQLKTEIADLHIQIDSRRRQQQVNEITETDYFRNLRISATKLRARSGASGADPETSPSALPTSPAPSPATAPPPAEGEAS